MKKRMKQSKLSALLSGGSIFLLLLAVLLCILNEVSTVAVRDTLESKHELVRMAFQLRDGSQYLTSEVRAYSTNSEKAHYDNYWNEVNNTKRRDTALERMREIGLLASEETQIQAVLDLSNSLIPLEEQAMEAVANGDHLKALSLMYGPQYNDGIAKISSMTETFIESLSTRCSNQVTAATTRQRMIFFIMLIAVAGVSAFQILSILFVKRIILQPVSKISDAMTRISQGDLSAQLELEPDTSEIGMLTAAVQSTQHTLTQYISEISTVVGEMAKGNLDQTIQSEYIGDFSAIKNAFETIFANLNRTFAKINSASHLVAESAGQVSTNAQTLAQGSTEQAAAVDEFKDTVTDISQHVRQTADNAGQADKRASGVGSEIERCNAMMQQAIDAMEEINRAAGQIGTIIKTIDDIAFQTNILALNAAVEAARAGAAGKGFAVVADEVRSLATKSAAAASDTTGLIDSAIRSVEKGTGIVGEAAQAMYGIVGNAQKVVSAIEQITAASSAQAESLHNVSEGMAQIASVVSTNSATAQESAAASEELSQQAALLKELMEQFRLRGTENALLSSGQV